MTTEVFQKKATLSLLITTGCFWGFTEFLAGTVIKDIYPDSVTGSVLIGLSFLFLAAGYTIYKNKVGVVLPLAISICMKLAGTLIIGKPVFHSSFINPVISMLIEAGVFYILYHVFLKHNQVSISKKIITGAAGGLLVALLFPLIKYLTSMPVCIKSGTNIPLSIYYMHFSVLTGALALSLGLSIDKLIIRLKLRTGQKSIIWGSNVFSGILIILSLLIIIID